MCGIVGYTGSEQAAPILLDGLSKLEYRGYDSAGLAVRDGELPVQVVKAKGRLKVLDEKTDGGAAHDIRMNCFPSSFSKYLVFKNLIPVPKTPLGSY